MHALAPKRLSRSLTLCISVLFLASCGQGDGPVSIAGTPATPLPPIPPGFCDTINFEILCAPPGIVNFNGGATTIIDNPDPTGINDSDKVAQMQKFPDDPTLLFGGTKLELGAAIDFGAGEAYKVKVWSPRSVAVAFKLEEAGNPGGGRTLELNHSGSSSWEELCYDYSGTTAGLNSPALTIIFDNGVAGAADTDPANWTFYYDDIEQVAGCAGTVPKVPATLPVDFEADRATYDFGPDGGFEGGFANVIPNPDASGINTSPQVARFEKNAGQVFAGSSLVLAPVSVADGSSFVMKVWSQRPVNMLLKLEPFDPFVELEVAHGGTGWEELTFAYPGFSGEVVGLTVIFDNGTPGDAEADPVNWTFYVDDIALVGPGGGPATEPAVAAPTPTAAAGNVISLFSDAYTDIAGIDYNPNWGQATVVTQESIAGNNTLKYAGLDYQGTDFSGNAQDVSGMDSLHVDFWTADSTALNISLISSGPVETAFALTITPGTWVSVDVPLTAFAGVDLTDIIQLKFDGNGTIFLDNLYFESSGPPPTEPVVAAPTPTEPEANVISLFSDAYTDIAGIDYNPNWGQATVVTQVSIAGNNTLKYEGLNYQGTDFTGNAQDVSGMTSLHVDFWTADSTALNVSLISSGPVETAFALTVTPFTWVSVDVPLTAFAGVDLTDIIQLKFDGNGTIFLDNLYFTTAGGAAGPGDELAINGGFETGAFNDGSPDASWQQFAGGGVQTITDVNPSSGTYAANLVVPVRVAGDSAVDNLIKNANLQAGNLTPGASITVSFDLRGSLSGDGGVIFAELFSELAAGGTSKAEILGGAPLNPNPDWTSYSYTTTLGPDVAGGVTLQLKTSCGPVVGCGVDAFFDNVSITLN